MNTKLYRYFVRFFPKYPMKNKIYTTLVNFVYILVEKFDKYIDDNCKKDI